MKIEEYRSIVHEDIEVARKIGSGNAAEEFLGGLFFVFYNLTLFFVNTFSSFNIS